MRSILSFAIAFTLLWNPGLASRPAIAPRPAWAEQALIGRAVAGFTTPRRPQKDVWVRQLLGVFMHPAFAAIGPDPAVLWMEDHAPSAGDHPMDMISRFSLANPWAGLNPSEEHFIDLFLRGFPIQAAMEGNFLVDQERAAAIFSAFAPGASPLAQDRQREIRYSAYMADPYRLLTEPPDSLVLALAEWFKTAPVSSQNIVRALRMSYQSDQAVATIAGIRVRATRDFLAGRLDIALNREWINWKVDGYLGALILVWAERHHRLPVDVTLIPLIKPLAQRFVVVEHPAPRPLPIPDVMPARSQRSMPNAKPVVPFGDEAAAAEWLDVHSEDDIRAVFNHSSFVADPILEFKKWFGGFSSFDDFSQEMVQHISGFRYTVMMRSIDRQFGIVLPRARRPASLDVLVAVTDTEAAILDALYNPIELSRPYSVHHIQRTTSLPRAVVEEAVTTLKIKKMIRASRIAQDWYGIMLSRSGRKRAKVLASSA